MMETLETIGTNPLVMRWAGLIVIALLGFGFMRIRRHPMASCVAFAGGIIGIGIVISLFRYIL